MTNVITRVHGKKLSEAFDEVKLKESVVSTCLAVHVPDGQIEIIANKSVEAVKKWLASRPEVTSIDIRNIVFKEMNKHHPEAAYLYEQHHVTI